MTTEKWELDASHSGIHFSVRHMVVAKVRGQFEKWEGSLELDTADLSKSSVSVTIDANSIDTKDPKRDEHLRSPDFLDVAKFPSLTFKSKGVTASGDKLKIAGDLTIHGVTREVVLDAEFAGRAKDPWGGERAGFSATTRVDRKDYGLAWNVALEAGGILVGDQVEIAIEVEAKKV